MGRGKQAVVYLDTHIVVWLYAGLTEKLTKNAKKEIDDCSDCPLDEIIDEALKIDWTRDIFDRLLTAEAQAKGSGFITADENI
jgi:PIN domain nuclease of toxin-antitoxin system